MSEQRKIVLVNTVTHDGFEYGKGIWDIGDGEGEISESLARKFLKFTWAVHPFVPIEQQVPRGAKVEAADAKEMRERNKAAIEHQAVVEAAVRNLAAEKMAKGEFVPQPPAPPKEVIKLTPKAVQPASK